MSKTVSCGGCGVPLGGDSVGIIVEGCSQQETAAAWEFVKFLMSGEQAAANHIETSVLLTADSAAERRDMKEFWADPPARNIRFPTARQAESPLRKFPSTLQSETALPQTSASSCLISK